MFRKKEVVQIEANLKWVVARDPQSGEYIGVCDMLNLNAIGDTWEEFTECANEAIAVLFADLVQENEFDAFLSERGWKMHGSLPRQGSPQFDVPFDIAQRPYPELMARA